MIREKYICKIWSELAKDVPEINELKLVIDKQIWKEEIVGEYRPDTKEIALSPQAVSFLSPVNLYILNRETDTDKIERVYFKEYGIKSTTASRVAFIILHEVGHYLQVKEKRYSLKNKYYTQFKNLTFCCKLCKAISYKLVPWEADADLYAISTLAKIKFRGNTCGDCCSRY